MLLRQLFSCRPADIYFALDTKKLGTFEFRLCKKKHFQNAAARSFCFPDAESTHSQGLS